MHNIKSTLFICLSVICFLLCTLLYLNSHSDKLIAAKAEYYFKKNDITKALKYYENAFEAGNENSRARDTYINLLITTPINTEIQKKIAKFIEIQIDDAAKYRAENFIYELRQEIHRKYPDNYILQAAYNQKIIHWANRTISYGFVNSKIVPEYYIKEIENAFKTWEYETNESVKFIPERNNPNILIQFNNLNPSASSEEKFVVAYTQPIIVGNKLKNMKIEFFVKDPNGDLFSKNQIYNSALHEAGHAIGIMGHSDSVRNVMHMSMDSVFVTNDLRIKLTKSDINTAKLLYNIEPEISNEELSVGIYTPFLVLGNEQEIANFKIREAKNYIKKAPNLPTGYIDIADAYLTLKDYGKVIYNLKKALTLIDDDESLAKLHYNLAVTYYYMKDYKKSIESLNKSEIIKQTETTKHLRAKILSESGEKDKAVLIYEDLIALNPNNIEYVIELTNMLIREQRYIEARNVLKGYIKINPKEKLNPRLAPYGILKAFL